MKNVKRGDLVVLCGDPHCPQSIAMVDRVVEDGVVVRYLDVDEIELPVWVPLGELTLITDLGVEVDFAGTDFILCHQSRAEGAPRAETWQFNHDWVEVRPWLAEIAIAARERK